MPHEHCNRTHSTLVLSLLASSLLLSGCGAVGLAAGAGAAMGIGAAKEGGLQNSIADEAIRVKISDLWFQKDVDIFRKLNLTVNQGRVLVTGVVQKPEDRVEAIRLAWQPKGVKQVINEIRVGDPATFGTYAQDTWISGQLRTRLTFDKYVQSINYSIETVQGTVYLMGVAQSQQELDTVISTAKRIKGVHEVISYVKFAGQPVLPENTGVPITATRTTVSSRQTGRPTQLTNERMPADTTYMPSPPSHVVTSPSSPSSIQSEVLPP